MLDCLSTSNSRPIFIGVTGGTASGKTSVCEM
jgi:uridine kinase